MAAALALVAFPLAVGTGSSPAQASGISYDQLTKVQKRLLSGGSALALHQDGGSDFNPTYTPRGNGDKGCQDVLSSNVKVNANCLNVSDPDLPAAARPTTRPPSPTTRTTRR